LVIAIGYDPVEFEPGLWNRGKKRNLIHIDVTSADIDNDYLPQVELIGNIGATVGALIDHVNAGGPAGSAELLREVAIERAAFAEKVPYAKALRNHRHSRDDLSPKIEALLLHLLSKKLDTTFSGVEFQNLLAKGVCLEKKCFAL
jgi:thiamine pyrophosphate-dependent acetolactate synthase large subunit-like protein